MPSDLLKNIKHTGTGVPASRAFQVILLLCIHIYYFITEMENYDTYTTTSALLVGIFYFMNKLRIIGKIISINNLYILTAIQARTKCIIKKTIIFEQRKIL